MIGIIGGSGFGETEGLEVLEIIEPHTPFGKVSGPIHIFKDYAGRKAAFLARHGKGHSVAPHKIPYKANLWAMFQLGVKKMVSVAATGAIDQTLSKGQYLVLENFIDMAGTESFYDGNPDITVPDDGSLQAGLINSNAVVHIDITNPFCQDMRKALFDSLNLTGLKVSLGGVYLQSRGPRLETAAEIRAFRLLGAHVVGMTLAHEAVLARELGMCFAGLAVVANMAAGLENRSIFAGLIEQEMKERQPEIMLALLDFVSNLPEGSCENCQEFLIMAVQSKAPES